MTAHVDRAALESFVNGLDSFSLWGPKRQIDYFAYFLSTRGNGDFSVAQIEKCFALAALRPYSRVHRYLSENVTKKGGGRYVKTKQGYALERGFRESIQAEIDEEPKRVLLSAALKSLLNSVTDTHENSFLAEALSCYRAKAFRAAILMTWILTIHHLAKHVFTQQLAAFNSVLAKNTDKRIRISSITTVDDFGEIPEERLIELCRSAGVLSNDVRKILQEKLGIRNSAAHPSGITVDGHKATEFITDLLNNVVLKY